MSYKEERTRRQRWPWGELAVTDCAVEESSDGEWTVRATWPGGSAITTRYKDEQGAHAFALTQQRSIYKQAHSPDKYRDRFPVLYVEPHAVSEWDWVIAMIPVPAMGGMQMGGYLVIDQSVHPPKGE